jgi:formylglycine-generating enzyme required for sulfatase activity
MAFRRTEWLIANPPDGTLLGLVPAGRFVVGGPEHFESGCDAFSVQLPSYYLALHPVTNGQFRSFVAATGHPFPRCFRAGQPRELVWDRSTFPEHEVDHPVVGVRVEDARAYCEWAEVRLPNELEWEAAARGIQGAVYPWGSSWDRDRCRHDENRRQETTADIWSHGNGCGTFGHYQLAGNVWEWCADAYERDAYKRYRRGDFTAPRGREQVVRGGSWFNLTPEDFRTTVRLSLSPGEADRHYGFRVARDVVPPATKNRAATP